MSVRVATAWCSLVLMCVLAAPTVALAQCPAEHVGLDLVLSQESAALVFVGTIQSVERAGSTETVTFEVERVWKGPVKERTIIYRPISPAGQITESPRVFGRDGRYLVIAHRLDATERRALGLDDREDTFGTSTCGDGSRQIAGTEPDLATLGPGRAPTDRQVRARNPKVAVPLRTKVVAPVYPEDARAAGIRGNVFVEIWLDETGKVTRTSVVRSIPSLDQAAIDCVMKWEFLPAMIEGRPMPTVMGVVVAFPP